MQGQEPAGGADQSQLTSAGEDQPSQGSPAPLTQGLGQHAVGGLGGGSVGGQIQTASGEQGGVEAGRVEAAVQGQGAVAGRADGVQLGLVQDQELSGAYW